MSELRLLAVLGCFLLSGLAGLVYETAWTQELTLVFGASELAIATVLGAYMAGLTLGAAVGGRWSRRVTRPVLAYGLLEAGVALSALLVPAAMGLASRLNVALLSRAELPPPGDAPASVAFHLVSSFVILLVPTGLMGATLPLLARHAVDTEENLGRRVGLLYASNTVGAAAGALLAAFVLLPRLGLGGAVWTAVASNALVFLLAILLSRGSHTSLPEAPTPPEPVRAGLILPLMAASGAVSFTLEVLWTRLLSHVLGGSIYAFGTMLATFLTGIAAGSALGARLATTREHARRWFAVAQLLVAGLSLVAFVLVDRIAERWSGRALRGEFWEGIWLCAATLLPSTLAIGATFPLAVRILAGGKGDAGPATARIYAWNTIGAVVGALGAGLFWLPALQFAGTMAAAAATSLALAVVAALGTRPRLTRVAAMGLAGLLALAVVRPATPWRVLRSSVLAAVASRPTDDPDTEDAVEIRGRVLYYGVGRSATVLVREQGAEWRLTTNGLPESLIQPPGSRTGRYALAHWMSVLPLALRPESRSMLVIGLGGGSTLEDLPPSLKTVDVVELEPEVVAVNRLLSRRRRTDPLADPRVHLHIDDARSSLQLARRSYDAIVSQPSHPWTSGSSHLFTREFYELAARRLEPGGVFVQWIGFAFVDEGLLRTLLATLGSVFPHVEVYQPPATGACLLVASRLPLDPMATAPDGIAAAAESWSTLGVRIPEDLLAARVLDGEGSASLAEGAPLNTDRLNLFQTRSPRVLSHPLTTAAADRAFASEDSVRRLPEGADPLRVLRRLLDQGAFGRALRLATAIRSPETRRVAFGLVDVATGHADRGRAALFALLARERGAGALLAELEDTPATTEAPFGLLLSARLDILGPGAPPALTGWARRDPLASALLEGWQRVADGRAAAVADLEPQLAGVAPGHPAYAAATRLRVQWRIATGDPARAHEGLPLIDGLIAVRQGQADLMLRARLAAATRDPELLRVTLYELSPNLRRSGSRALAEESVRLLDSVPGGDPGERARLRTLLTTGQEARNGAPRAATAPLP